MTLLKTIVLGLTYFLTSNMYGQNNCFIAGNFETISIGNEQEKLPIQLIINFSKDSIIMYYDEETKLRKDLQTFLIESQKCEWSEDSTKNIYFKVKFTDKGVEKHSLLNLAFRGDKAKFVEIQHEGKEKIVMWLSDDKIKLKD
ncbi:MAG: hypothetical protein KAY50_02095 [Chitinophagaceae bacterium]|nr:hypothetical protein [Chitinophagaceae bacterium]